MFLLAARYLPRTILASRWGVTHVLMMGLLVQHSALGTGGVLAFHSICMLLFNIILLCPSICICIFCTSFWKNVQNITFNHDHVAMITQAGINRPQNSAEEAYLYTVWRE